MDCRNLPCTCEITPEHLCPTHCLGPTGPTAPSGGTRGQCCGAPMTQDYVVGFLFSADHEQVYLIKKNHPEWQRGKLNGIGGKIEFGESPEAAMRREFQEEAGLDITGWRRFCEIHFIDCRVYFFEITHSGGWMPRAMTDEPLFVADVACINSLPIIPNLSWLIPLALEKSNGSQTSAIATTKQDDTRNG